MLPTPKRCREMLKKLIPEDMTDEEPLNMSRTNLHKRVAWTFETVLVSEIEAIINGMVALGMIEHPWNDVYKIPTKASKDEL